MINLRQEDYQKIALIDKLFGATDIKQLTELTESEIIVAKLKGTEDSGGILSTLLQEHSIAQAEITIMRNELISLKSDISVLIKCLNSSIYGYNQDFHNLKQKHNVY